MNEPNTSPLRRFVGRVGARTMFVMIVLPTVALLAGLYMGRLAAYSALNADPQTVRGMRLEIAQLQEELKLATDDLQLQRTLRDVDSRALEMVRSEMANQKERTAELEEDLRFYRSLVAPDDKSNGLSLREPELVSSATPGHINYRFSIQQKARKHTQVEGNLAVSVYGHEGEREVSYPLEALSSGAEEGAFALSFRYFQLIEGEMALPAGFEPDGVTVVASISKPRKAELSEQFRWELKERFTNVGK